MVNAQYSLDILSFIDDTFKGMGIKYAFISGTALGLGREGKIIDNDTDVDFCIHSTERAMLDTIISVFGRSKCKVLSTEDFEGRREYVGFEWQDNWLEMDFIHTRKDKVWYSAYESQSGKWITKIYPAQFWETLQFTRHKDSERAFPTLCPLETYLRMTYGDDWRTPNLNFWHGEEGQLRKTESRDFNYDLRED